MIACDECDGSLVTVAGVGASAYFAPCPYCRPEDARREMYAPDFEEFMRAKCARMDPPLVQ